MAAGVDDFLQTLWLERGLSANTLASYRSDLERYVDWLARRDGALLSVGREDIEAYLSDRFDGG